ncbi:unnamed protein product [Meganyctiphanes norvegica]|uniref:Uncharacterized protein n=1 Tax=Meganyctiphanes norvegica TaxID=48144 RepID=A0AAV2SBN5_MEGNR
MLLQITLVVALACAANAEASYGHQNIQQQPIFPGGQNYPTPNGPCVPQFRYVTQTQIQQVPVVQTQNVAVPTTIFQTRTETVAVTVTVPQFSTETQFRTETVTETQTQVVTDVQEVTRIQVSTTVSFTPQFITRTAVQTRVALRTEFVPRYVTQTVSQAHYVTVCPQPNQKPYW